MTALILSILGVITALIAVLVLLLQMRLLILGRVEVDENYDGPAQVRRALHILLRMGLKRLVILRKLFFQYLLHVWVRFLFYIDKLTTALYARSRNFFVKNAVKNKSSVSHFWEHLKVYKQEIDKEKDENE